MPEWIRRQMPFARTSILADGVRLSVVDDGPGPRRSEVAQDPHGPVRDPHETLLFLHGNPVWSFLWRNLLGPGRDAGCRVVAPDHAGCGLSAKPEDPSYYDLRRHTLNLEAVADALGLRDITLVMHDWGGPIGMDFATRRPELVSRLVVCNTTAFAPRRPRAFTRWHKTFASPLGYRAGVAFNLVGRSALRFGVRRPLPREVRRAYLWPLREKGARVAAGRFVQMVPDGPEHPTSAILREVEAGLRRLKGKPVLVLWADRDPVMGPRLAERWRETPLDVVDVRHVSATAGHFWQEDDPGAFVGPLLEFVGGR